MLFRIHQKTSLFSLTASANKLKRHKNKKWHKGAFFKLALQIVLHNSFTFCLQILYWPPLQMGLPLSLTISWQMKNKFGLKKNKPWSSLKFIHKLFYLCSAESGFPPEFIKRASAKNSATETKALKHVVGDDDSFSTSSSPGKLYYPLSFLVLNKNH